MGTTWKVYWMCPAKKGMFLIVLLASLLVVSTETGSAQGRGNRRGYGAGKNQIGVCGKNAGYGQKRGQRVGGMRGAGNRWRHQASSATISSGTSATGKTSQQECGIAQAFIEEATPPSFQEIRGDFQQLVHNHECIERTGEEIPDGVRSVTLTSDPDLLSILRKHPREIKQHLEKGGRVRMWDPLFVEMIHQQKHIHMLIRDVERGVEVTTTSDHPEVVKLIRAHAAKVSDFVKHGPQAAHQETQLPDGYTAP